MTKEEREEIRRDINTRPLTDFISLEKSKGNNMFCCPICRSGTGKNHTGALSIKDKNGRYIVNCFANGCFDGATNTLGALRVIWNCGETEAMERAGYMIDNGSIKKPARRQAEEKKPEPAEEPAEDFINFYREANEALKGNDDAKAYLAGRGISEETIDHFLIGYCENWKAKTNNSFGNNRLIIPLAKDGYVTRATKSGDPKRVLNDGRKPPFNLSQGLKQNKQPYVFIVEGAFDAMSIYEAGEPGVIALCGTDNNYFLEAAKNYTDKVYIIALDNDDAGNKAAAELKKKLEALKLVVKCTDTQKLYLSHKDANEALTDNREAFINAISEEIRKAKALLRPLIYNAAESIRPTEAGAPYDREIEEMQKYANRKTGFDNIDRYLTLYPGLAALGGQASLGKTTFAVNLALSLLRQGEHVLYFALEQRAEELLTKVIAQELYRTGNTDTTNLQLNAGKRNAAIDAARAELADKVKHFNIVECDFETTEAEIETVTNKYMEANPGIKPIVIVDYLQLIAEPLDFRGGDKERIDYNLKALKKMQKQHKLFVLVVSSFNRSSNLEHISYESFFGTSMIEYTCDYVFGLQLQIQDADNDEFYFKSKATETTRQQRNKMIHEEQQKNPKPVQFVAIKNRRGKQYFTANFDYYPAHDFFMETEGSNYTNSYSSIIDGTIEAAEKKMNIKNAFNFFDDDEDDE